MEIPYYILAIAYLVGLLVYSLFMAFNIYHLIRFGMMDSVIRAHILLMLCLTAIILVFTVLLVWNVTWTDTISIFDFNSLTSGGNDLGYE